MSDDGDKESKTNEPTEKKITDTISKGNVPVSREVPVLFSFAAILFICSFILSTGVASIENFLTKMFEGAGTFRLDTSFEANELMFAALQPVFFIVFPILLILMAAGVLSSLAQNPLQLSLERIQPQLSRISLVAGLKRIFGFRGLADFAKSLFKFLSIGIVVILIIKSDAQLTLSTMIRPPEIIPSMLLGLLTKLTGAVTLIALMLATFDTVWSRIAWRRDLRMSHQEVKEEHKDAEGNPQIKGRARALARQRSSKRMMAAVPTATLVITNPTHFAIALRYVRSEGGAPVVVAKGQDNIALRIRGIAEEKNIAIIENKPLARAMYEKTTIGSEIPQEFFKAVAELIHFLQMRSTTQYAELRG